MMDRSTRPWRGGAELRASGVVAAAALALCAGGCMASPPEGALVDGPTLSIEIPTVSQADVAGRELVVEAPLGEPSRTLHADFVAANAGTLNAERLIAVQGARVGLRPGAGVAELNDAFDGLMIFVAPESDPTARLSLASAVAPAGPGPVALELIARRSEYEGAQTVLRGSRFLVGVSGPSPLAAGPMVEFGLRVELDVAIIEIKSGKGGH